MKKTKGLLKFLIATITTVGIISGISLPASAEGRYEFDVISDTHVKGGDKTSIGNTALALNCIKNNFPNSKCIVINGDIVDDNKTESYNALYNIIKYVNSNTANSTYNTSYLKGSTTKLPYIYFNYGNHEFRATASASSSNYTTNLNTFNSNINTIQNYLKKNGRTADISTNPRDAGQSYDVQYVNPSTNDRFFFLGSDGIVSGNTDNSYLNPNYQLKYLGTTIAANKTEAKNKGIKKPLFLFSHQPVVDTVWGSEATTNWGNITNKSDLVAKLKNNPEVIMFTSHTHNRFIKGYGGDNFFSLGGNDSWGNIFSTSSVTEPLNNAIKPEGYHVIVWSDGVTVNGVKYCDNGSIEKISSRTVYY